MALLIVIAASACSGTPPTAPTPPPVVTVPPVVPKEIAKASFKSVGDLSFTCSTSAPVSCREVVMQVTNSGPGCARSLRPIVRFTLTGPSGPTQVGGDVTMYLPGADVFEYLWRPGVTLSLVSFGSFADVSRATNYQFDETHTDVECPAL